jgi:hypothetical protein
MSDGARQYLDAVQARIRELQFTDEGEVRHVLNELFRSLADLTARVEAIEQDKCCGNCL